MQIPLIKGDKVHPNADYGDALPVNMTAINKPIKGATGYMNQWYGLTNYATGFGVDRGARWVSRLNGHYRVSGNAFIRVNSDKTVDNLGTIPGTGQCSIAFSFNNIAIVADRKLYYYSTALGLRQITDADVGNPLDIVWADGVFILTDGENLYHSDPLNEESYEPLDFATAEFRPDTTYGVGINEDNQLLAFGATTTEYFTNTGGANFLYSRISQKALKLGIAGTHCKKEFDGKWYVIGRREETSLGVFMIQGGSSKKISTREVDKLLQSYTNYSQVTIDAFQDEAVSYLLFHLPGHTLLYNENIAETMGGWLAWSLLKSDIVGDKPFRGKNLVRTPDVAQWIAGDRENGNIGSLDASVATQYGNIAEWILYTPLIKLERLTVNELEAETIPGFSLDNDATVFLSQTTDGITYSPEWVQLYGENLKYSQRFIIRRLGYVRNHVGYKLRGASKSRMSFALLRILAA